MASNSPEIEVLGDFSIDEKGNYQNDSSQRRFLVETVNDHLQFDLRDGIDDYIAQNQRKVRYASLSSVQDWIHDNMQELTERKILETARGGSRKLNVDFVGSADVFSLLLRACECIDRLEILVRRCNGTYYIESSLRKTQPRRQVAPLPAPAPRPAPPPAPAPAPQQLFHRPPTMFPIHFSQRSRFGGGRPIATSRAPRSARESNRTRISGQSYSRRTLTGSRATTPARNELSEMKYAGRKFATSITSTDEGGVPTADEPVNANAKYVVVMKRQLGDHSLILSTDVQAERIDSNQTPPGNYVCIRSRRAHLDGKPFTNFIRYKTLEWWSQAYIAGIPEVLCGMRDDRRHEITSVKTFEVKQLPEMSDGFWKPRICRKKFKAYLSAIKTLIQDDNPRVVYRLELPELRPGPGIKDRLQKRKFIFHPPTEEDSVILTDQYRLDVLNIQENN